jgi:hypothetical protein
MAFVLKALRPDFGDLANAAVDVAHLVVQLQAVNLEGGVGQKVLDEVGQAGAIGLHLGQNFHLARTQRAEFFRQ